MLGFQLLYNKFELGATVVVNIHFFWFLNESKYIQQKPENIIIILYI